LISYGLFRLKVHIVFGLTIKDLKKDSFNKNPLQPKSWIADCAINIRKDEKLLYSNYSK